MTCAHTHYEGCEPCGCVTITLSRADAAYMVEDEWVDDRLARIANACREALKEER